MRDLLLVFLIFAFLALGCGGSSGPKPEWTKTTRIAGSEKGFSHVSGIVADDKAVYVVIGGTIADEKAGTNGLRRVALDTGAVTNLDNGEKTPQSETGGVAGDDKYIYWNAGGSILRILKAGGTAEVVTSENVGVGIDMAVDDDKVYWTNHSYYSANSPSVPKPIFMATKKGGPAEIFADLQDIPSNVAVDDRYVYWLTPTSILEQEKTGGQPQVIYQTSDKEGVDVLEQDVENLYFGFRGAGESRWALRKISKNGGEPQTLVKTFSLKPFVVDGQNIYFFDEASLMSDLICRVAKNGGEVVDLDSGYASGAIAQTGTKVFFGSLDTIYSIDK